ncbi:uncharacterized protein LOC117168026 [Belonocnema kinseyi]|uniref:uncharacterized protein LOC117168026 n=1 Tax=Belonocnema kinseyi TaxID=2817044 RepID=UPI00143DF031|nr:uncharacterized protein LOC117168026 [Belonocnema kinseyi]
MRTLIMGALTYILVTCLLLQHTEVLALPIWNLVHDVIQWNLVGIPIIHQKTNWNFDPRLGEYRRGKYVQENGDLGKDLIKRLGQGVDVTPPIRLSKQSY